MRRIIDSRENVDIYKELTQEEIEARKDVLTVQNMPRRLNRLLVEPYFKTEVLIEKVINKA